MKIRHLLADLHGCTAPLLDDVDALLGLLRAAAANVGAHEYGRTTARYVPHGVTAVLILAESHMIVSTWPEHRLALVEILLCNEDMDPEEAFGAIREGLVPDHVELHQTVRGIHP
ncbi:MAG: adenosylmethionine decarboxylase [Proteobacteria bacterium]|nr:adenosylmethionine decarboxylase [Pseudomonadota bacterium]